MIAAYSFLAAFPLQILAMSVLMPAWWVRYVRTLAQRIPPERLEQLYPGIDHLQVLERYLNRYRWLNYCVAVLGIFLGIGLYLYLQRPDWSDGPVEAWVGAYFMVQALPFAYMIFLAARHSDVAKHLSESRRTAILKRRGLFDFVSPFTVALAVLGYVGFAAYVLYIWRDPFPGFSGYATIACVTLVYVLNGLNVYWQLYRRRATSFEPHTSRMRSIALGVKACMYSCIAVVAYLSLNFTLVRLDLQRWEPFALSIMFVITALICAFSFAPARADQDQIPSHGHL